MNSTMSNQESVPEQIKRFRKELELSAREVSIALGRDGAYIWKVENGKINLPLDALVEIAGWFAKRGKFLQLVGRTEATGNFCAAVGG